MSPFSAPVYEPISDKVDKKDAGDDDDVMSWHGMAPIAAPVSSPTDETHEGWQEGQDLRRKERQKTSGERRSDLARKIDQDSLAGWRNWYVPESCHRRPGTRQHCVALELNLDGVFGEKKAITVEE